VEQTKNFGSASVAAAWPGVALACGVFEVGNFSRSAQTGGGNEPHVTVNIVNFVGFERWPTCTIIPAFRSEFEHCRPRRKPVRHAERHADVRPRV